LMKTSSLCFQLDQTKRCTVVVVGLCEKNNWLVRYIDDKSNRWPPVNLYLHQLSSQ
jgi:hypothetical protein